jgi:CheY-like chemotaxis protein
MKKSLETDFLPWHLRLYSLPLKAVGRSAGTKTRRILIVDNDSNTTHLVKILLERSGPYLVLEENDATEAYQTARNFKPDLILLELIMSGLDGAEVAAQIHADHNLNNTHIIFQTALVTGAEAKSGFHIDGHRVVPKPINIPELIEAIEEHLHARQNCNEFGSLATESPDRLTSLSSTRERALR